MVPFIFGKIYLMVQNGFKHYMFAAIVFKPARHSC